MVRTALAVNGTVVLETELEPQRLHIQCNLSVPVRGMVVMKGVQCG